MAESWRSAFLESALGWLDTLSAALPRLASAAALILIGWAAAAFVRFSVRRLSHALGVDRAAARPQLARLLSRGGVEELPSAWLGRIGFWLVALGFLLIAIDVLGLQGARETLGRLVAFLPQLVAAALIWLAGSLAAGMARGLAASTASASGLPSPERAGRLAGASVLILTAALAVEQLGLDTFLVVTLAAVVTASAGLSLGIALALGARPIVSHILAGHYLRRSLTPGEVVAAAGRRGVVEGVGTVETEFRDGERRWTVPNAQLLEEVVEH